MTSSKSHWQPKMDKTYLLDDLNDWLVDVGSIQSDTKMTQREIEIILEAFECRKAQWRKDHP